MFTGLVETTGLVIARQERRGGVRLSIQHDFAERQGQAVILGESISVSGACLTVAALVEALPISSSGPTGPASFEVDVSPETLDKTTLGSTEVGTRLNLERSLTLEARLGGHLVTGHVDAVGEVLSVEPVGDMTRIAIAIPGDLRRFVARKGSLCVDGVSLTVNDIVDRDDDARAELLIIPHTRQSTTLGQLAAGRRVNLEIDLIARYIERLLAGLPRNSG